jgi:hypothetical protein
MPREIAKTLTTTRAGICSLVELNLETFFLGGGGVTSAFYVWASLKALKLFSHIVLKKVHTYKHKVLKNLVGQIYAETINLSDVM